MIAFFTKILGRSWLVRVYKVDKLLFFILTLFFAGTLAANLLRLQVTPFFVWDMYSWKIPEVNAYPYYEIHYNHDQLINLRHTWNEPQKTYLYAPLNLYAADKADPAMDRFRRYLEDIWLKKHPRFARLTGGLTITGAEVDAYPMWFKGYLSTVTGRKINDVTVLKKMIHFDDAGTPVELSSDTVLHIP